MNSTREHHAMRHPDERTITEFRTVFGVRPTLLGNFPPHESGTEHERKVMDTALYTLAFDLVLSPAT